MARRGIVVLAALAALGAVSCSDPPTEPRIGAARVTIATSGLELDRDGYRVQLGTALSQDISINGTIVLTDLSAGTHDVTIDGVAGNCVVSGANPRPVDVAAADTADVAFAVTCTGTFASVSAGHEHTCGITSEGTAYCWGVNRNGILGIGTISGPEQCDSSCSTQPLPVQDDLGFVVVDAGTSHTCGLTTSGMAYCWGANTYGRLGDGTEQDRWSPAAVLGGPAFVAVDVGRFHTCGITAAGLAYCWGYNGYGQLGDGTVANRLAPTPVAGGITFATVSAGGQHTCGITPGGATYCWGDHAGGQLGGAPATGSCPHPTYPCSTVPTLVTGGLSFVTVSAGRLHTCGIIPGGAAYCWGDNRFGELGIEPGTSPDACGTPCSRTPVAVTGGLTFAAVSAGELRHTCGIATGGAAYCWGELRELGAWPSPVIVPGGHRFAALDTGQFFNCGLTIEDTAYCWGRNNQGQLGDGSTTDGHLPVKVTGQP